MTSGIYNLTFPIAPTGLRSEEGVRSKSQRWRTGLHPVTPTGSGKEKLILVKMYKKQIDMLDDRIDNLVYDLYDLTDEEIEIVEGSLG